MIGQREGLAYLVPLALEQLECDLVVSGDHYEGDRLENVQRLPAKFWDQHPALRERWRLVQVAVAVLPPA